MNEEFKCDHCQKECEELHTFGYFHKLYMEYGDICLCTECWNLATQMLDVKEEVA
jgi:hypothetical protein